MARRLGSSTPRIPRPRGRSPIAAWVSASMPVVRKRSSAVPLWSMTPERCVARSRQLRRRLDELLQERVERELRAERDPGVDEDAQAVECGLLRHVPPGVAAQRRRQQDALNTTDLSERRPRCPLADCAYHGHNAPVARCGSSPQRRFGRPPMRERGRAADPGYMNCLAALATSATSPVAEGGRRDALGLVTCSADASLRKSLPS